MSPVLKIKNQRRTERKNGKYKTSSHSEQLQEKQQVRTKLYPPRVSFLGHRKKEKMEERKVEEREGGNL